jgi:hypothetical protein
MEATMSERGNIQALARTGGVLYLIIIVIGVLGEALIRNTLVVPGNAAETARRILESEFLWRAGIAGQLVLLFCALGLTLVWYRLLRPVNRNLTLLAVFFALMSLAVESVSALHLQAVLAPLSTAEFLAAADPAPFHQLAYLSVIAHTHTFAIALAFFGVECLIIGYLVRKSGFLPKIIGTLMQIAGACYLINTFAMILYPPLASNLFPTILVPAFIGESAFCLWLLIKGIESAGWERRLEMA